MKKGKKTLIGFSIIFGLLIVIFSFIYMPNKLISIKPEDVSMLELFNGNSGESLTVTDELEISQIISNLNNIKFQKGKPSLFRLGYGYKLTIYNKNNKVELALMVNDNDTIRYQGFFYTAKEGKINIDTIDRLFEN